MLTPDETALVLQTLLGIGEPSERIVEQHRHFESIEDLSVHLMRSERFRTRTAMLQRRMPTEDGPNAAPVVLQHPPKCAGSSLHAFLTEQLGEPFPERHNGLGNWPAMDLAQAAFFSGHFDTASLSMIPVQSLRVCTILRDPTKRLISLYRYLRAVNLRASRVQRRSFHLAGLAKRHTPEQFFRLPELRWHPSINNGLVRLFAGSTGLHSWEGQLQPDKQIPVLDDPASSPEFAAASKHVCEMTAVVVVDHLQETMPVLCRELGLPAHATLPVVNRTSHLQTTSPDFTKAPPTAITTSLREALAPHITLDQPLYDAAVAQWTSSSA